MKTLGAGALVLLVFLLANVVAAGVMAVLMPLALELEGDADRLAAGLVIGLLAVACAIVFMRGALFYALELFAARADPNKGLQSVAGRRGG